MHRFAHSLVVVRMRLYKSTLICKPPNEAAETRDDLPNLICAL